VSGSFDCVYTVDEGVCEVDIRISVCGVLVWAGMVRANEITGRHLQSYGIAEGAMFGLVVLPNGCYMAVSYFNSIGPKLPKMDLLPLPSLYSLRNNIHDMPLA
jgi:hypothetical protein